VIDFNSVRICVAASERASRGLLESERVRLSVGLRVPVSERGKITL